MENLDVKPLNQEVDSKKNNWWKLTAIVSVFFIIVLSVLIYFYCSENSKLIKSKNVIQPKMCSGVDVVFFAGGNEKDSFASVVAGGAKTAENDLGANVQYVYSGWDSGKMTAQFIDAISGTPDAIAVMGHPGVKALTPLIDEAEHKGIIVTSQNVDLTDVRNKYTSAGFGYVGQNLYESGLMVSNAIIRKYNVPEGAEAIVFGVNQVLNPSRYVRTKGEIDGLINNKITVHEVSMPLEVEQDASSIEAQNMIAEALAAYPNTKIIITDHGQLTASVATHLKNIGKNPGDLIVAGFDLSTGTVAGIRNNYIGLILDQQPYLQGYLPILQACLTKKYGFAGLYINTGIGLIDKSNVDLVANLAEQGIR